MLSVGTHSSPIETFTFAAGTFRVAAAMMDGQQPAKEFFLNDLDKSDKTKMQVLFDYIAATGRIGNKEKFKKIEGTDDLFEFKCHQIRMPCFWDRHGTLWITHGFKKKQDRTPEAEKTRAKEIRNSHRLQIGGGG